MKLFKIFKKESTSEPAPIPDVLNPIGWAHSNIYTYKNFKPYNEDVLLNNKGVEIYKKMMHDDQIKAVMRFKQYAVISREWFFDVEEGNNEHQEIADFYTAMIDQISGSFKDKLIAVLSSMINGYSIIEKLYCNFIYNSKPYWAIEDLMKLPFHTFDFVVDAHGRIQKLLQNQDNKEVEIPMNRIIHHVHQPDVDRLYGESDLRAAYRPYWSKDITIKFRNIHLERHATGFMYATIKGNLGPQDRNKLEAFINNVSARASIMLPEQVELNKFDAVRTDAYEKASIQDDKAIAKSILVPNLLGLSEQGQTGSYSQSQTQFEAFLWILDYEAGRLAEVLNEQMFKELALWNFGTEDFPRFKFEPITDTMKGEIAKRWNELVKGGSVTKSESDETWIRNLMGAPEKMEEEIDDLDPAIPEADTLDWLLNQPEEDLQFMKREFSEKPWLRRVNFARIEKNLNTTDKIFSQDIADQMAKAIVRIEKQIASIAGQKSMGNVDPDKLEKIVFPNPITAKIKKLIRGHCKNSLDMHYSLAKKELPRKQFKRVIGQGMDKLQAERFLSSAAMRVGGQLSNKVKDLVIRHLENAMKYDYTLTQTVDRLLDSDLVNYIPTHEYYTSHGVMDIRAVNIPARIETMVRTINSDAMNQARLAMFGDPELKGFIQALEYSAILDDRTTDICASLHGRIMKNFNEFVPPNHYNCRSILVPVTIVDNWDGKESNPPSIRPQQGFK